jgi:histidinol phosphatase-like enzyme
MAKYPAIFLGRDGTTIDDLSQSFIIYDYPSDVLCGKYVGIASDYVLKRQGVKHKNGI